MIERSRRFNDLTKPEKAVFIGALVGLATFFAAFIVYYQVAVVEDSFHIFNLLNSGMSMLIAMRLMILSFYFITLFPTVIAAVLTVGGLQKRSIIFILKNTLFGLAVTGTAFLLSALLLTLFALLFSGASLEIQVVFESFAFLIPMVVMIRILTSKKLHRFSRKLYE